MKHPDIFIHYHNPLKFLVRLIPLAMLISNVTAVDTNVVYDWQETYSGKEVNGKNIIAFWNFDSTDKGADSSGNNHTLKLKGNASFNAQGHSGSCLEPITDWKNNRQPNGAEVIHHQTLCPQNGFTIEMWIKIKPDFFNINQNHAWLLDKMHLPYRHPNPKIETCRDYSMILRRFPNGKTVIQALLGFGDKAAQYSSTALDLNANTWYHIAFSYDGDGTGCFYYNGKKVGQTHYEGLGEITPGSNNLVIGDRTGKRFRGFQGFIDSVRITDDVLVFKSGQVELTFIGKRNSFLRMEKDAELKIRIKNGTTRKVENGYGSVNNGYKIIKLQLPALEPDQDHIISVPVSSALKTGKYSYSFKTSYKSSAKELSSTLTIPVTLVNRPLLRMPVILWDFSNDIPKIKEFGFTDRLMNLTNLRRIWDAGKPTGAVTPVKLSKYSADLNQALIDNFGIVAYLLPGKWAAMKNQLLRIDRTGKPYIGKRERNVCTHNKKVGQFCYNTGASIAQTFGKFPALKGALINSDCRSKTNICYHPEDQKAYRQYSGKKYPENIIDKKGMDYRCFRSFPVCRIIPDDYPELNFYRWFWTNGDGWNRLNSELTRGLQSTPRKNIWTCYDPALRTPAISGSGGNVDFISQWTYTHPTPLKVGMTVDELFAMVELAPRKQEVMSMTQLVWYRSQTAPISDDIDDTPPEKKWEEEYPATSFISIAPDHLREALWETISRPVKGIMYHGWGCLVSNVKGAYTCTNTETEPTLKTLLKNIIRPLGPLLMQVPDSKSDVAFLESFTSQMLALRGTYGWANGWKANAYMILRHAALQPEVIYEQTILDKGLDQFKILVLVNCDILTKNIVSKIEQFQNRGGIVIGDENLAPGVIPNIFIKSVENSGKGDQDKQTILVKAKELRHQLDNFYQRKVDSSNPEVIVRTRCYKTTRYLFAINDKRSFGDYVGHHGKVMEKGVPTKSVIKINQHEGYVYDLIKHQPVQQTRIENNKLFVPVSLKAAEGKLLMITNRKIAEIALKMNASVKTGDKQTIQIAINDSLGKPVDAVMPVKVSIFDANMKPVEFSGYYGAKDGILKIELDIAENDLIGTWKVKVRELASGKDIEKTFHVID